MVCDDLEFSEVIHKLLYVLFFILWPIIICSSFLKKAKVNKICNENQNKSLYDIIIKIGGLDMLKINRKKHCSLDKDIRRLFYKKQNINNSNNYSEEEKKLLTAKIEKDIIEIWEKVK